MTFPTWSAVALAYARPPIRDALTSILQLDVKLAQSLAGATEPALAQIKLAWWRDELRKPRRDGDPFPPDPLLANLTRDFHGHENVPIALIDGWESLLTEQPWAEAACTAFIAGRAKSFAGLAALSPRPEAAKAASEHGRYWAMADLTTMQPNVGYDQPGSLPKLPRELRALAVIGGLARRALLRGGKPMFGDRWSPFAAIRLGIFGS